MIDEHTEQEAESELLSRAREEPPSADLEDVLSALSDPGVPRRELDEALRTLLDASVVSAEEAATALVEVTKSDQYEDQVPAVQLLGVVADEEAAALVPHLDHLLTLAAESDVMNTGAASCLVPIAREAPEEVLAEIERVEPLLAESHLPQVRQAAVGLLVVLSTDHAGELGEFVPTLLEVAGEQTDTSVPPIGGGGPGSTERNRGPTEIQERLATQQQQTSNRIREGAALTVASVAAADPDAVAPAVDTLVSLAEDADNPVVREFALDSLRALGNDQPAEVLPYCDRLAVILADTDRMAAPNVQGGAARVLSTLANWDGDAVTDAVLGADGAIESAHELLDADDQQVRGSAASLFAYLTEYAPEECIDALDTLVAIAEDEGEASIRGSAVWALRFLGTSLEEGTPDHTTVLTTLETVASDDPDPDIRAVADDALSVLE